MESGEEFLHSPANAAKSEREEVEDGVSQSASDRSDAADTDDDDMWSMKPVARDKLSACYSQMPRMHWILATEK
eukprot:9743784-Karenia_brevis.AAC.1